MSTKEIFGFLTIRPSESVEKANDPVQTEVQAGNVMFKNVTRRRTIQFWDTNNAGSSPQIKLQPWKMAGLMLDNDDTVGHSWIGGSSVRTPVYPMDPPTPAIGTLDYKKFRATGATTSILSTVVSRVIGSVGAHDNLVSDVWLSQNGMISLNDIPTEYTQIGIVYPHPIIIDSANINTVLNAGYITFADAHYLDNVRVYELVHNIVRIVSGADAGLYYARYVDLLNNRCYLQNLDGTLYVGQATASNVSTWATNSRRAFYNEVSVIKSSAGTVVTGGTFRPGAARNSFILRVVFDKTGSDASASAAEQQGSYFITLKPYTHGEGLYLDDPKGTDIARPSDTILHMGTALTPFSFNFWDGGVNAIGYDELNQRVWFSYTNTSNQTGIGHWRWKTGEGFREIANYLNTGAHKTFLTPSLVIGAGDIVRDIRVAADGTAYVSIYHATAGNGGVAIIKPDLTTLQYNTGSLIAAAASAVSGSALDASRSRTGTPADASTNGADQITSASGAFTAADIGRAIKLTGLGADNGTYKISAVGGATTVNVTTLIGGGVTFTTQSGGTFQIGDRLYLFFNNATTGAGKINYMEALAPGTFHTRTVSMSNGANCNIPAKFGEQSKVSIDPANGNVYWNSTDTVNQVNKYDPLANSHALLSVANVQSPFGGTGTVGTITGFTALMVNTKFDEIWAGTDFGHVKIVKSTFAAATVKRYNGDYSVTSTPYSNPPGFQRPQGTPNSPVMTRVRNYWQHPDGRVMTSMNDSASTAEMLAYYSREADLWAFRENWQTNPSSYVGNFCFDNIGNYFYLLPTATSTAPECGFGNVEVTYQWDNANTRWIPLEVAQTAIPNKSVSDTLNSGCRSKPMHAGLEDVLYGVKIGFTKAGGAVPANNEFLGRAAQISLTKTDGATTEGSTTFSGSGFSAADVGRIVRIEGDFATGTFTLTGNPANNDTVTTGTKVYTFQTTLTNVDGNVKIGATASDSLDNLIDAINLGPGAGTDYATAMTANPVVAALATAGDTMKVTALVAGLAGNLIYTLESCANGFWGTSAAAPSPTLGGTLYRVTAHLTGTTITLKKMDFTTYTPGTAGSLTYSVWDLGSVGGLTAGPEHCTVLLADGFGKDNTQDISGIVYDSFHFKTLLEEQVEPTKFCVANPIGVPGSLEMKVYYDFFARVGTAVLASHDLATTQIRALPASEHSGGGFDGRKLVDGFVDGLMDASGSNRGLMDSSPSNPSVWYGTLAGDGYGFLTPVGSALGCAPMVDLGADAEIGFIIVRGRSKSTQSLVYTAVSHGLKANLYKANNAGGAPVASATSRTSGTTNLSGTINVNTITTSGDFLGAVTTGPFSNGSVVSGQSVFNAPAATFVQGDVGKVLKITSVGDVGSYRITAVDGTGAIATIRNLNQTTKTWLTTVSSIVYEVRDGVREEDVVCVPSIGSPTQRLCIERLLTPTTAQVRIAPHTTFSAQSWQCAVPTWTPVKRISNNTEAVPPEVKNNGTWVSEDGREQFDPQDWKIYIDLTDLTTAQRTGRWWQMQMMPRGANAHSGDFFFSTFEFYSPAGARLGISRNTFCNNALDNADFLSHHINRLDLIQSRYDATGIAGFNGTADLGGASGDTLTLAGGNKFLGYQVRRPYSDGVSTAGASGAFSSATAVFLTSDVGRILRITSGADAGLYRIATRVNATDITVTPANGVGSVSWTGATGAAFTIHEGVSAGGVAPDRIVFLDDLTREYTIATINVALDTITIVEARQTAVTGKQWEIRRPAFDTTSGSVDSTKTARLVRPATTYPLQTGDVAHDSRGALRFHADDIGSGNQRSDGSVTGGDDVFVGSGFCADDVGRLLYITTGVTANRGVYKIWFFNSSTSVAVLNAYTGAAVVFAADAAADKVYKIFGDRRFKITKQVTTLRA